MKGIVAILIMGSLAGCLQEAPDSETIVPEGCDQPIFPGVRGREVDVTVDPNDRSRVAATAMLTPPSYEGNPGNTDLPVWQALARSNDGGLTWDWSFLPGWPGDPSHVDPVYAGAVGLGDGIISFAPNGDLYLSAIVLTALLQYDMVAFRFEGDALSPAETTVFSRGGYAEELNEVPGFNPIAYNDKNDQVVDPVTGEWYVSWMWRSNLRGMNTVPVVVKSTDGGSTWEGPTMLIDSIAAGVTADDANVAPAPFILGDNVYVVWSKMGLDSLWAASAPRSTLDFGEPYKIADLAPGGSSSANILTFPMVNVATGPRPDGTGERAYVTTIQGGDGYDVGLWYTDDGQTWHAVTPHDEAANGQLLPTVAVGPDGRVATQFMDFSEDPDDVSFHAVNTISGDLATWDAFHMSAEPTNTMHSGDVVQGHVGDYTGNAFTSVGLFGAWQDGRMGTADAPFSEIYGCVIPL